MNPTLSIGGIVKSVLIVLSPLLFIVLPIWLSGRNFKWKNQFAYGVLPAIIAFWIYQYYVCRGWLCDLVLIIYGGSTSLFFVLFVLSSLVRKNYVKAKVWLLYAAVGILVGLFLGAVLGNTVLKSSGGSGF